MTSKSDTWVVLGKPECQWCHKVVDLLVRNDQKVVYMDLITKPDLREFLMNCGFVTVPQVYKNGVWMGGYEDVANHFEHKKDRDQLELEI